ncbi:50S ribosomal protein L13 [Patescibacteria group bacterium]|nr:50S ribosomal protein L13 [Patescibacteria group bacterium]
MNQKTYSPKASEIEHHWRSIDLNDQILGRAATEIAVLLIGKGKPYFVPHLDCGDYVVAINAGKIKVTGKKRKQKIYYRHSGYPGGFKQIPFERMMEKDPAKVIELAVRGMLPKNKLRDRRMRRLKVFADDKHPYEDKFREKEKI